MTDHKALIEELNHRGEDEIVRLLAALWTEIARAEQAEAERKKEYDAKIWYSNLAANLRADCTGAVERANELEVQLARAKRIIAKQREALAAIQQRANERHAGPSYLAMERDTVYAMHDLASAAMALTLEEPKP